MDVKSMRKRLRGGQLSKQKEITRLRMEWFSDAWGILCIKGFGLGEYRCHNFVELTCTLLVIHEIAIRRHVQKIVPYEEYCNPFCAYE